MKAQDYVDKYLPLINKTEDKKELTNIVYEAFLEFNDEIVEISKLRNAKKDKALISIVKEVGQKWGKFCRIINTKQKIVTLNEELFLKHWKEKLKF